VADSDDSVAMAEEAVVCIIFFFLMFAWRQQVGIETRRFGKWETEGLRSGVDSKELEAAMAIL
jgi:hypothetical protein